jgi:sulfur-carrier protein adenylyltransferase/sulfurtransferase
MTTVPDLRTSQPSQLSLTPDELARYSRHLILPDVGEQGQHLLKRARVLLVGAGGLGSPCALYLAAAGVGTLGIVDSDEVDVTNLQRQVLYGTSDVGERKTSAARARIHDINPHVQVKEFDARFNSVNAVGIVRGFDMVVDGSDNFPTRYLLNDVAVMLGIPDVFGSVHRFEGQVSVFSAAGGPCYRCLFREPPVPGAIPSCAEAGILGVLPGIVGTVQATEVIKLILGIGRPLIGRLLLIDGLEMTFRSIELRRDPDCPSCGEGRSPVLVDYDLECEAAATAAITPQELAERVARGDDIDIVDVREPYEWMIARIPGARLVPLGEIEDAMESFDPKQETVLYCRTGVRSLAAAERLREAGIVRVLNLTGGIMRWREEVDPSIPRY